MNRQKCALRGGASIKVLAALISATSAVFSAVPACAGSLPTNGKYVSGSGAIQKSSGGMTIDQSSTTGIIDWHSFSIGAGKTVQFDNGSGATLNEVTGNNLSTIAGSLRGTGSVYLVNPSGVVVTSTGRVLTQGNFGATTGTATGNIANAGSIVAAHGDVTLGGNNIANSGAIVSAQGGHIWLNATGTANLGGTINAANANGTGGSIAASGKTINVSGKLDASGARGGGTIVIGSWSADAANIAKSATLDASATQAGEGGHISVISNDTHFSGSALARGGAQSGSGGLIETSGHTLAFAGSRVDASAAHGKDGLWLLDPYNLTVNAAAATTIDGALNGNTSVLLQTTASGCTGAGTCAAGAGDIDIMSALGWNTSATLTLDAYHSVAIDAPMTISGAGGLTIKTNDGGSGGTLNFGLDPNGFAGEVSYTNLVGGTPQGALTINGTSYTLLGTLAAVQAINATSGSLGGNYALADSLNASAYSGWVPIGTDGSGNVQNGGNGFSGVFEGLGHSISNLNIYLPNAIDVGMFGYASGTLRDIALSAAFVGGESDVGILVGDAALNANIVNASSSGEAVSLFSGAEAVGGLAGLSDGAISDSWSSAQIYEPSGGYAGGLVGSSGSGGSITGSYATGSVQSQTYGGGLSGENLGSIASSYATGMVSGTSLLGGLVALNNGSITGSYATGAVTGPITGSGNDIGGLVGQNLNAGTISASYATGVVAAGRSGTAVGGFVGDNAGTINTSYATGSVSGNSIVGGFVGENDFPGQITFCYALGGVSQSGSGSFVAGGFAGANDDFFNGSFYVSATIDRSYAAGTVSNGGNGFVGNDEHPGGITESYWDTSTGPSQGGTTSGVSGLTTAQMHSTSSFASGWHFGGLGSFLQWVIVDVNGSLNNAGGAAGGTMPMLLAEYSTTIVNAHELQLMELAPGAAYSLGANINLSATSGGIFWGAQGFIPIGGNAAAAFTGSLSGDGFSLSNLFENATTGETLVGLFGEIGTTGSVSGVTLTGANLTGGSGTDVGALAGENLGTLSLDSSGGTLTGSGSVVIGGLVGVNEGTLSQDSASGSVSGGTTGTAGGLVGENNAGTITLGAASDAVSGNIAGGLAGTNSAAISQSDATGAVTGQGSSAEAGGLLGQNAALGTITQSFAMGGVTLAGGAIGVLGGLAGANMGGISQSYATGNVSGGNAGGLAGQNGGSIAQSYSTGVVTGGAGGDAGGLVGLNVAGGTIAQSFALGPVTGGSSLGGLIGLENGNANDITASYWDTQTTGLTQVAGNDASESGAAGETTAQLQAALPAGFAGAQWAILPGISFPYLQWQFTGTPEVISGSLANSISALLQVNGATISPAVSLDANGTYYLLLAPGTLGPSSNVVVYETGANGGALFTDGVSGSLTNFNILPNFLLETTPDASYSTVVSDLNNAVGSNGALQTFLAGLSDLEIAPTAANFAIDSAINDTLVVLSSTGAVTQSAAINAGSLDLLGTGGTYTLTNGANAVGTLAANTGTVSLNDGSNALAIGTAGGTNGVTATTLTLTDTGNVTQSQAITATNLDLLGTGGSYTLTDASNSIGTLAGNTGTASVTESGALDVGVVNGINGLTASGAITLAADGIAVDSVLSGTNVTLTSGGTIGEDISNGVIAANSLAGSAVGATTLQGANQVANLGNFTNTGGNFILVDDTALTIGGTLNAGSYAVGLGDTGTISESTGAIDANLLIGRSVGGLALNGANLIATLSAFTNSGAGGFALSDGETLNVNGAVNAGTGALALTTTGAGSNLAINKAIAAGGTATLISAGTITENASTGKITAASLTGSAAGATTLKGANQIASLGSFTNTGGNFALTDDEALTIAGTLNAGTHGVTLTDTATLGESTGSIDAATLTGNSAGGATLNGANLLGTLDAFANSGAGGFALTDGTKLTVKGAVNAGTGTLALTTTGTGDNLVVDAGLTGGTVDLVSAGTLGQNSSGIITAGTLSGSATTATLTAANDIADLGAFTSTGALSLSDAASLTVTGAVGSGGNLTLTTTGAGDNLAIDAALSDGTHEIALVSAGTIASNSSGILTAAKLTGSSVGGVSLTADNAIATLESFATGNGDFSLTDNRSLTIGGAVNAGSGTLSLTTLNAGNLAIDASITGGTVNLNAAAKASENASGAIIANLLNVTANTGITLTSSLNNIGSVGTDTTNSGPNKITL